tara:strand:+ start:41 stop:454 length:414 start_codon:yes stop_codon:yes gene_type:complete
MNASEVDYIVVHCSDSPQGRGDNAETIHRWHIENGWDGIGYHKVILENGDVENGRPIYWKGSHARPYNGSSLGVCLIGVDSFTDDQYSSLRREIFDLLKKFPAAKVVGHKDLNSGKTCPNFDVKGWWQGCYSTPQHN